MRTAYTIIEGRLIRGELSTNIPFALVFLEDGVFYVETFLPNKAFFDETHQNSYYRLVGKTEKGYDIEIESLRYTLFSYENLKIHLICYGHVKLSDNRKERLHADQAGKDDDSIYVVEVEGLQMEFADYTEIEKYRNDGKVDDLVEFDFDHTSCAMVINFAEGQGNYYKIIFSKTPTSGNITIDFTNHEGYNRLTYKNYITIRNALFSFLSFINGGHVWVRKELTGWFVTSSRGEYINSQCVYIYSRKKASVGALSDFIPINDHHSYSSKIFPDLFLSCFNRYYQLDKALDFQSLVFSLNHATRTSGLAEKYFILITALEKICSNYAKSTSDIKQCLIDADLFNTLIKPEIDAALKKYEGLIKYNSPKAYNVLKSKVGNLNQINKGETAQKFRSFFNFCGITVNQEVERLIETERNQAVHEGVIGLTEEEKIQNYWKLDHILRDAILNLIEYKSYRTYVYEYFKGQ